MVLSLDLLRKRMVPSGGLGVSSGSGGGGRADRSMDDGLEPLGLGDAGSGATFHLATSGAAPRGGIHVNIRKGWNLKCVFHRSSLEEVAADQKVISDIGGNGLMRLMGALWWRKPLLREVFWKKSA